MNANISPGSWSRTAAGCPHMFRCGNGVFLDGAFSFLALKQRTSESNHHKFGDLTNKHSGLIQNSGDGLWPKGRYRSWSQLQWKNRSGPPIHRKHSFYSGFKKQPAGSSKSIFYPNKLKGSILHVHDQPFVGWYHWSPTGTTSLKEGPFFFRWLQGSLHGQVRIKGQEFFYQYWTAELKTGSSERWGAAGWLKP